MRYKLKAKGQNETKNFDDIFETLETIKQRNNFESLTTIEENFVNQKTLEKYNIDFFDLFKATKYDEPEFTLISKKIQQMFLNLFLNDLDLNFASTNILLQHFNSKEHKRFAKTRIPKTNHTKKYLNCVIVVTYYLHFICANISDLKRAIDRLYEFGLNSNRFRCVQKWDFLTFLLDVKEMGYMENFLNDDIWIFKNSLFKRKPKYEQAQKLWRNIFIDAHYVPDTGKKNYAKNENKLMVFLEWLIDKSVQEQRSLCGFKLTVAVKEDPPVLQEYLIYIQQALGRGLFVNDIVEISNWENFVNHKMRGEYGYKDFWKKLANKK